MRIGKGWVYVYVVVLIAFCLMTVNSQRGGSRSRSSSSRSSSSYYRSSSYKSKNCTTVDGVTTCVTVEEPLQTYQVVLLVGVFVAFVGFAFYSSIKD